MSTLAKRNHLACCRTSTKILRFLTFAANAFQTPCHKACRRIFVCWRRSPELFYTASLLGICANGFLFCPLSAFEKRPGSAGRQPPVSSLRRSPCLGRTTPGRIFWFSVLRRRYSIETPGSDTASLKRLIPIQGRKSKSSRMYRYLSSWMATQLRTSDSQNFRASSSRSLLDMCSGSLFSQCLPARQTHARVRFRTAGLSWPAAVFSRPATPRNLTR